MTDEEIRKLSRETIYSETSIRDVVSNAERLGIVTVSGVRSILDAAAMIGTTPGAVMVALENLRRANWAF